MFFLSVIAKRYYKNINKNISKYIWLFNIIILNECKGDG
jgi:hypothetical protein